MRLSLIDRTVIVLRLLMQKSARHLNEVAALVDDAIQRFCVLPRDAAAPHVCNFCEVDV